MMQISSLFRYITLTSITLLAVAMVLANSSTVNAQQWTSPDSNGNISNTNSGNVGVGTASATPAAVLHVKGGGAEFLSSATQLTAVAQLSNSRILSEISDLLVG